MLRDAGLAAARHDVRVLAVAAILAALAAGGCASRQQCECFAGAYSGPVPMTLVNDTDQPICIVQLSPAVEPNWGLDWLGVDEVIPVGAARTFMIRPGGSWDVRLLNCSRAPIVERFGVALTAGETSAATLTPLAPRPSAGPQPPPAPPTPPAPSPPPATEPILTQ